MFGDCIREPLNELDAKISSTEKEPAFHHINPFIYIYIYINPKIKQANMSSCVFSPMQTVNTLSVVGNTVKCNVLWRTLKKHAVRLALTNVNLKQYVMRYRGG